MLPGFSGWPFASNNREFATVASVSGQRFFCDVTAQNTAGTGQVRLDFGHDAAADEASFGPFSVSIP